MRRQCGRCKSLCCVKFFDFGAKVSALNVFIPVNIHGGRTQVRLFLFEFSASMDAQSQRSVRDSVTSLLLSAGH